MEKLERFSPEVIGEIGCYVYRLIDPRNGQTFYVGKGKGNRVFAHANEALKNYDGENYQSENEDDISEKIKTIRDIKNSGLEVIAVIHRWGMDDDTAFQVESALIDCYPGLSNAAAGHDSEHGICNVTELNDSRKRSYYDEPEFPYLIIKTTQGHINELGGNIYEAVRRAWKIDISNAQKCKYVFAVVKGIVKAVFEPERWEPADGEEGRYQFFGKEVPESVSMPFVSHRIPEYYSKKGMASPVLYSKKKKQ